MPMHMISVIFHGLAVVPAISKPKQPQAGDLLHFEDHLHGPYELKAPPNPRYEELKFGGYGVLSNLEVGIVLPERFDSAKPHPAILFFSGGGQQRYNWEDWCARFFDVSRANGLAQDWILIAPIAPSGVDANVLLEEMPQLFDAVRTRYTIEGDRFHLMGQSNGGNKAFKLAIRHPEEFASLTVHTGAPWTRQTNLLSRLQHLHIFMYCGVLDTGFHKMMKEAANALLSSGHPPELFEAVEFPGVGHFGILDVLTERSQLESFWQSLESLRRNSSMSHQTLLLAPPDGQFEEGRFEHLEEGHPGKEL